MGEGEEESATAVSGAGRRGVGRGWSGLARAQVAWPGVDATRARGADCPARVRLKVGVGPDRWGPQVSE
jgi:hypothetical protein